LLTVLAVNVDMVLLKQNLIMFKLSDARRAAAEALVQASMRGGERELVLGFTCSGEINAIIGAKYLKDHMSNGIEMQRYEIDEEEERKTGREGEEKNVIL
jgi:hypothetical protein